MTEIQCECPITMSQFKAYMLYKSFDMLSDGTYKKIVVKCKDNGDEWAVKMHHDVHAVIQSIKNINLEIVSLVEFGKRRLHEVCTEVQSAMTPPCRVRSGWHICHITGLRSNECIDLTRAGRSESIITIHKDFQHFVIMLWYVLKIEHIAKALTRSWLQQKGGAQFTAVNTVNNMCSMFSREWDNRLDTMYNVYQYAYKHSMLSIIHHKQTSDYELRISKDTKKHKSK